MLLFLMHHAPPINKKSPIRNQYFYQRKLNKTKLKPLVKNQSTLDKENSNI